VRIQGCIFDLHGVLTDTAEYHCQGWQRLADALGIPFDRTRNEALHVTRLLLPCCGWQC
jgi:beta-phosphoglucomutase-like phosphatase (HAD superfamily)